MSYSVSRLSGCFLECLLAGYLSLIPETAAVVQGPWVWLKLGTVSKETKQSKRTRTMVVGKQRLFFFWAGVYGDEEGYPGRSHSMQGPRAGVWPACSTRSKQDHVAAAKWLGEVQTTCVERRSRAGDAVVYRREWPFEWSGGHWRVLSMADAFKRWLWWSTENVLPVCKSGSPETTQDANAIIQTRPNGGSARMVLGETVKRSDWRSALKRAPTLTLTRLCHGIIAKRDKPPKFTLQHI